MEAAEQAYERALIEKHARFAVVDFALTKAENKLAKLEPWCVLGFVALCGCEGGAMGCFVA
jgi:hypothetical protein